jgi:hypothetical protein
MNKLLNEQDCKEKDFKRGLRIELGKNSQIPVRMLAKL